MAGDPVHATSKVRDSSRGRTADLVVSILFALFIATPLGAMAARKRAPTTLVAENRNASPKPACPRDWRSAIGFPSAFEAWWNDVFGARETLLHADAFLQWFVMESSPAGLFFRGRNDWLFYTGDDSRAFSIAVAGPAALLVSKIHKIAERLAEGRAARLDDKDALDVLRLLQAIETARLASSLSVCAHDLMSREVTLEALASLRTLFADQRAAGTAMAVRAAGALADADAIAESCAILASDLLKAVGV